MPWYQRVISLPPAACGLQLITPQIIAAMPEIRRIRVGLLHLFIQHTSASLTINENADPDVPRDLAASLDAIVPEQFPYLHTIEGPDDMPAHVKTSLLDSSLTIPVADGRLELGTWQGIYLCEYRLQGSSRQVVATLQGEEF